VADSEAVKLGGMGLEVALAGLGPSHFNYHWLRDNCSTLFDSTTRERVFDIFHLDSAPRPRSAQIAGDQLEVAWVVIGCGSIGPEKFLNRLDGIAHLSCPCPCP
jgi:gamma-butyrobetaine dioxygenase